MSVPTLLTIAVILAIAHPIIMRILLQISEPMRLRMAASGTELLSSSLNADQKDQVEFMLNTAFDWRFMAAAAFCAPAVLTMMVLGMTFITPFDEIKRADLVAKVDGLMDMHIKATAAANPVMALVVAVEFLIAVPFLWVTHMMGKEVSIKQAAERLAMEIERHSASQLGLV